MNKSICLKTSVSTAVAALVYAFVVYVFGQSVELVNVVVFAAIYGVLFFLSQLYVSKRIKKKK